ncbi:hypothetical protein GS496_14160 [Rhodococcus hoagii]|nr:hypothetical protein [Prescottella equi]ORL41331.1 hypothetical protein A6F59_10920 [Prescottella equi]
MAVINPDNASVFDEGEVYLLDWNYTGSVEDVIPAPGEVPGPEWLDAGLLGTEGVTYTPGLEKTFYDGWGHPRFKGKTSKGTMELSFNALEQNTVTKRIAYGKHDGYVSLPKGFKAHLLIITREDDVEEIEVTTRPALLTTGAWTKSESGVRTFPSTADLFGDSEGRVLRKVDEATAGPASYVVTMPSGTTAGSFALRLNDQTVVGISYNAASTAVKGAIESILPPDAGSITVTGPNGGPWTVELPDGGALSSPTASLTPTGQVAVTPVP